MKQETEEAKRLVNLFFDEKLQGVMGVEFARRKAVQYALIAVDEKIKSLEDVAGCISMEQIGSWVKGIEFWQRVKEAINNLK